MQVWPVQTEHGAVLTVCSEPRQLAAKCTVSTSPSHKINCAVFLLRILQSEAVSGYAQREDVQVDEWASPVRTACELGRTKTTTPTPCFEETKETQRVVVAAEEEGARQRTRVSTNPPITGSPNPLQWIPKRPCEGSEEASIPPHKDRRRRWVGNPPCMAAALQGGQAKKHVSWAAL